MRRNKRLNPRNNSNISSHIISDYRNIDIKRDNITYQLGYTNVAICVLCSMTYSTCQLIQNKKKIINDTASIIMHACLVMTDKGRPFFY